MSSFNYRSGSNSNNQRNGARGRNKQSEDSRRPNQNNKEFPSYNFNSNARLGSSTGIPILHYGSAKGSNFYQFKEAFITYAFREYGDLARCLVDNDYYIPEEVEDPVMVRPENLAEDAEFDNDPYSTKNDPHGLALSATKELRHERLKRILRMETDKSKLYGLLWGHMSTESRAKVKEDQEFDDQLKDPLTLWIIIQRTHRGNIGNTKYDQQLARQHYSEVKQQKYESVAHFKERFDNALDRLDSVDVPLPSDATQASDFINRLDQSRFAPLLATIKNNALLRIAEPPETLTEAYMIANNFNVSTPVLHSNSTRNNYGYNNNNGSNQPIFTMATPAANLAFTTRHNKGNRNNSNRGGNHSNNNSNNNSNHPNQKNNASHGKTIKYPCAICGDLHWVTNCPFLDSCKQHVSHKKSPDNILVHKKVSFNLETPDTNSAHYSSSPRAHNNNSARSNNNGNNSRGGGSSISLATIFSNNTINDNNTEEQLDQFDLLLDNQATVSIFNNPQLMTNIRAIENNEHISIKGVGGELSVHEFGDAGNFGTIYYHPKALANILSFSQVILMKHRIDYDSQNDIFIIRIKNSSRTYKFINKNGLYICNVRYLLKSSSSTNDPINPSSTTKIAFPSIAENESKYTKREIQAARQAKELKRLLGYPSDRDLLELVKTGIRDVPIDVKDVHRAHDIYGADLAELKGKTKAKPSAIVKIDSSPRPISEVQTLHVDVFFVQGIPFLISVSKPLGYTMVDQLLNRSTHVIEQALLNHINAYKLEGFQIHTLLSDGEGAIAALTNRLLSMGIHFNPAGPGEHVPVVENKIRQLKERIRCHLHALYFILPFSLLPWLVYYCVQRLNLVPDHVRVDQSSPREQFTGRKLNFKTDLRIGFGDYAQTITPNQTKNSMLARTLGGIALLPVGNVQGSVYFLNLATMSVVTRDHWINLPIPQDVVLRLNSMANSQKTKIINKDPTFQLGFTKMSLSDDTPIIDDPGEHAFLPPIDTFRDPLARTNIGQDYLPPSLPIVPYDDSPAPPPIFIPSADSAYRGATTTSFDYSDVHDNYYDDDIVGGGSSEHNSNSNLSSAEENESINPTINEEDESINPNINQEENESINPSINNQEDESSITPTIINQRYNLRSNPKRKLFEEYAFRITVKKALKTFGKAAQDSISAELLQLLEKKVFQPVLFSQLSHKQRKSIIRSHMFLKEKFKASGLFDKLKARLVAGGDQQDRSLYDDISSSTVSITTILIIIFIAALEGRIVITVDIAGAYLNADIISSEVLMRIDPTLAALLVELDPSYAQYLCEDGSIIVKLLKALYGCIESAKLWNEHITGTLKANGFIVNEYDPCVLNKTINGNQLTICIYVDDLLITSKDPEAIEYAINVLENAYKTITCNRGKVHSYLGMNFDFSTNQQVTIKMNGFIEDIITQYKVEGTATTPASPNLFNVREDSESLDKAKADEFHSIVAKLLYLAKRVRPDILLAVSFLTTRIKSPNDDDFNKLSRILKYLNDTKDLGITLKANDTNTIKVYAYVDASHGSHDNCRGHTGGIISLGHGPIHVKSSKQKINSKSSAETELIGLSDYTSQVIWTSNFLRNQGYSSTEPAIIYQDNKSTITMATKGRSNAEHTRHINIRYFFVKDIIDNKQIKLIYLKSEEMIADILTKPLQGELFRSLRSKLLNM